MRRIAVVAVVQRPDHRFLMSHHYIAGGFQFAGGKLENEDRSVRDGAARELLEETGLKVPLRFLGYKDDEPGWLSLIFHGTWVQEEVHGTLTHREPDKHGPWEWYTPLEAASKGRLTLGALMVLQQFFVGDPLVPITYLK